MAVSAVATPSARGGDIKTPPGTSFWSIEDSINARYIVADPTGPFTGWIGWDGEPAVFSRDRSMFAVLYRAGNLECDCFSYSIALYRSQDVRADARLKKPISYPRLTVRRDSRGNLSGIEQLTWSEDGTRLYFLGAVGNGQQIFYILPTTGEVKRVTDGTRNVSKFIVRGDNIIYFSPLPRASQSENIRFVDRDEFEEVRAGSAHSGFETYKALPGGSDRLLVKENLGATPRRSAEWVSPDGRFAILPLTAPRIHFRLVDLAAGTSKPVCDVAENRPASAQTSTAQFEPQVAWNSDSSGALLIAAARPTPGDIPKGFVYRFSLSNSRCESISPYRINARLPAESRFHSGMTVFVREGVNQPPTPVARTPDGSIALLGPDPVVASRALHPSVEIAWTASDGSRAAAGLVLPHTPKPEHGYPLVVQLYYYDPNLFRPDGPFPQGFAAQQLATAGFAVLNMAMPKVTSLDREGDVFVQEFDKVINKLAVSGQVDPTRLGLSGFSHSGYLVYYAITHPGKYHISAAISAASWSASYVEYLETALSGRSDRAISLQYGIFNGGSPAADFWSERDSWLAHAPGFNLNQVRSPLLMMMNGSIREATEMYGGLSLLNKPVDLLYFPQATHQLQRPSERLAAMRATEAWMRFWLMDGSVPEESSDLGRRWRRLRECAKSEPAAASSSDC